MSPVPYRLIFELLYKRKIRYLVAGGFAVNFHQVQRATVDLDLIVDLENDNLKQFIGIMKELNFVPRVPVSAEDLMDQKKRRSWIDEKGMMVFSFLNPNNPFEIVDIFIEDLPDFEQLWKRRFQVNAFGGIIDVIAREDLIKMKLNAGRDKDLYDAQQLQQSENT